MAEYNVADNQTLVQLAAQSHNGRIIDIAEVLDEYIPVLKSAEFEESNMIAGHKLSRRTALPTGSWRKINAGVAVAASTLQPIIEPIAILEGISEIDEELVNLSRDKAKYLMNEEHSFIEGLGQEFEDTFFYGEQADTPEELDGLATRYDAATDSQVIDEGGSGSDCTSIWVVGWGRGKGVTLVYPKGSKTGGIEHIYNGRVRVTDGTNPYWAYSSQFKLRIGIAIYDADAVQRIASIESAGSSNIFDPDNLVTAINNLPRGVRPVIYVNKTIHTQMDINLMDKTNTSYTMAEGYGKKILHFRGVPIFRTDAITITETAL